MATTDKQIALVEKAIQGVTVLLLGICSFFLVRAIGTMDKLVDKVADLDKRVAVLEYENGRD